jgi:hypothetical protein
VSDNIVVKATEVLESLEELLQAVESFLRENGATYRTQGNIHVRRSDVSRDDEWGGFTTRAAEKKKSKKKTAVGIIESASCTAEFRIAEYFAIIRDEKLWPTLKPFKTESISEIVSRIARVSGFDNHNCLEKQECPLLQRLRGLLPSASAMKGSFNGLCLPCIKGWDRKSETRFRCTCGADLSKMDEELD